MKALVVVLVVVALTVWVLVPGAWWVTSALLWVAAFVLKHALRDRVRTGSLSEVMDLIDHEQRTARR